MLSFTDARHKVIEVAGSISRPLLRAQVEIEQALLFAPRMRRRPERVSNALANFARVDALTRLYCRDNASRS
jgi:hypothetical protein